MSWCYKTSCAQGLRDHIRKQGDNRLSGPENGYKSPNSECAQNRCCVTEYANIASWKTTSYIKYRLKGRLLNTIIKHKVTTQLLPINGKHFSTRTFSYSSICLSIINMHTRRHTKTVRHTIIHSIQYTMHSKSPAGCWHTHFNDLFLVVFKWFRSILC